MRIHHFLIFLSFILMNIVHSQSLIGPNFSKYSTSTSLLINGENSSFQGDEIQQNHPLIPTFDGYYHASVVVSKDSIIWFNQSCTLNDIQVLSLQGDDVYSTISDQKRLMGSLFHIRFQPNLLPKVLNLPGLVYIDIASRINSPRKNNDTSRQLSKVNIVEQGQLNGYVNNYTGKGVMVGIVDIGFQTDHPTFFNADGTHYRVRTFWNQQINSGNKPNLFNYGTEFTDSTSILNTLDDDGAHGTHVAGIAAGSGLASPNLKYRGMAPESDLHFVGIKYANDTLGGSGLGDYVVANPTIIDGYKYLFNLANQNQQPCVTNLSWGMHTGPHDGTSLFDQAVDKLAAPGHVMVGAAGNEANNRMHIGAFLNGDTAYSIAIDRSRKDYRNESIYIDAWGDPNKTLSIKLSLTDSFGNELISTKWNKAGDCKNCGFYKEVVHFGTDTLTVIWSEQVYFGNNKPNMLMLINNNNSKKNYVKISVTASGGFHAWNSGQVYRWTSGGFWQGHNDQSFGSKFISGSRDFSVGENGGSGNNTLTAGAYVARNQWVNYLGTPINQPWYAAGDIASFSSRGPLPTPSGNYSNTRQKPDILAPGQNIASALHNRQLAPWLDNQIVSKSTFRGKDQYYVLFSGTSMASPHACGIVALYLQANPNLSPADIKKLWRIFHQRDQFTGSDSNSNAGYGKIEAEETIKFLEKYLIVNANDNHGLKEILVYNKVNQQLSLLNEEVRIGENWAFSQILLTDISGKGIKTQKSDIPNTWILPELTEGIYFVRIWNSQSSTTYTGKIFITK